MKERAKAILFYVPAGCAVRIQNDDKHTAVTLPEDLAPSVSVRGNRRSTGMSMATAAGRIAQWAIAAAV